MLRYEHGGNRPEDVDIRLDFSVNVNPLGLPGSAKEAVRSSVELFSAYPDCGCSLLRAALSKKHGIETDRILCGNGASDLIFRVCAAFGRQTALLLAPTFSEYERTVKLFGGTVAEFALRKENGFALTDGILDALDGGIGLFFLCNPNNPTGRLADARLLDAILERCNKNGVLLIVDECFLEFTMAKSLVSELSRYKNLLILRAFTKFYGMAGLRLGYLMGEPSLLNRIRQFGPEWNVSTAAQAAGVAALAEPDWETRTQALIGAERRYMAYALVELGLTVFESQSNFLLAESELPLYRALLGKRILVRACENFTGLDEHFIRIGLKTHEENMALIDAIREVTHG